LFRSPIDWTVEWAIHDFEDFEGAEVGECFIFSAVVELADFIGERCEFVRKFPIIFGGNIEDAKSRCDGYAGEYDSLADYAEELTEQTGATIPQRLAPHIDYNAVAHDDEQSGGIFTFRVSVRAQNT